MNLLDQTAYPLDATRCELEMSEPMARYVLALLDVDDYEHSPNDHETAELRRSIEQQLTRAQQQAPRTGPMPVDVTTRHERAVIEQSTFAVAVQSSEEILTVIEHVHACYDYCASWKEAEQQDAPDDDHPGVD